MNYLKLSLLSLVLCACSQVNREPATSMANEAIESVALPQGFTIVEQNPNGFFIRIASAHMATNSEIRVLANTLIGNFDRVDLCVDFASDRGEEYGAIIGSQYFDYIDDEIYQISTLY